jgi:hypothetical protein
LQNGGAMQESAAGALRQQQLYIAAQFWICAGR